MSEARSRLINILHKRPKTCHSKSLFCKYKQCYYYLSITSKDRKYNVIQYKENYHTNTINKQKQINNADTEQNNYKRYL